MGASRWLDANKLAGTSMDSAMAKATIVFSRFIRFSSGIEMGGRCRIGDRRGAAPRPQRFATGSVYCFKYAPDRRSDFFRWMFLSCQDRSNEFHFYKSVWLTSKGREAQNPEGHWYSLRVLPRT